MAGIQFCRFRPRGRILRSPISRRMWHVGTRAKKLMFELADFLHAYKNQALPYARRSVDLLFLETESVTNSNRSFTWLNSTHSGHSGI